MFLTFNDISGVIGYWEYTVVKSYFKKILYIVQEAGILLNTIITYGSLVVLYF